MKATLDKIVNSLGGGAKASTKNADETDQLTSSRKSKISEALSKKRSSMEDLAQASTNTNNDDKYPEFKGDPQDRVIIYDLDETLIAGDKNPINAKREKEINAMGDREVVTIAKDDPENTYGEEIKYVRRPGVEHLLENRMALGYKQAACTRNYSKRAEVICKKDPVLKKYILGSIGRTELESDLNKDFKKHPHHPDKLSFFAKIKSWMKNTFIVFPKFLWLKFKSIFSGANIRWTVESGSLGKYPPNIIEMLKANGNHNFDDCEQARFLVDNSDKRETRDMKLSGDWAYVNSNEDSNGDGKKTAFFATDPVKKLMLKDPESGEEKESYLWVKNTIEQIDKGWRQQYKDTTGKEPKV